MNPVLFSRKSDDWATPKELYQRLDSQYHFDHDPCPLSSTNQDVGIFSNWGMMNFVNPPYSNIAQFLQTALNYFLNDGKQSIFLLPSRTDTKWFHDIVLPHATKIEFIKGRLKFNDSKNSAPFPSMVVYFVKDTSTTKKGDLERIRKIVEHHTKFPPTNDFNKSIAFNKIAQVFGISEV